MTNTATLPRLMRKDCTCLLGSKDPMTPFHQLVHLSFSMLDDLHSKLLAYGASQQNVQCNLKVLATGAGKEKVKPAKFSGQPSHPLLSPASSWQNVVARVNVGDHANVIATPWSAHNCVAVNAKNKTMIQVKFKQVTSVCCSILCFCHNNLRYHIGNFTETVLVHIIVIISL